MPFNVFRRLEFEDGPLVLYGVNDTRAKVAAEYPSAPIGSIYIHSPNTGTTGRVYVKTAHTGSGQTADWTKITTTAAD